MPNSTLPLPHADRLFPYDQFKIDHPGEKPAMSWCCAYCAHVTVAPKWKLVCGNCGAPYLSRFAEIDAVSQIARRS